MSGKEPVINKERIEQYLTYQREQERSKATLQKYRHNLRHLFARTFYSIEKDLSRLADILGHTNLSTTRIYTAESGMVHARQMERMKLIVT